MNVEKKKQLVHSTMREAMSHVRHVASPNSYPSARASLSRLVTPPHWASDNIRVIFLSAIDLALYF